MRRIHIGGSVVVPIRIKSMEHNDLKGSTKNTSYYQHRRKKSKKSAAVVVKVEVKVETEEENNSSQMRYQ